MNAGAVNETEADAFPGAAPTPVGAPGAVTRLNVPVTACEALIVTLQAPLPVHAPDQLDK